MFWAFSKNQKDELEKWRDEEDSTLCIGWKNQRVNEKIMFEIVFNSCLCVSHTESWQWLRKSFLKNKWRTHVSDCLQQLALCITYGESWLMTQQTFWWASSPLVLQINDALMFQIFSNRWLCVSPRESWPMTQQIMGVLPRLLLLVGVARGGLLGAGTGEGSCAAPPFREVVNVCLIFYVKNI